MTPDAVQQARRAGDHAQAIDLALTAWRATRHPVIADVVAHLGSQAPFDAPTARSHAVFDAAWRARVNTDDTVTRGWLFATVAQRLARPKADTWRTRLTLLAPHAPDPRLAAAIVDALRAVPVKPGRTPEHMLYQPALALLRRAGDPRQADALEQLLERPTSSRASLRRYFAETIPDVIDALRQLEVGRPDDLDAWRALLPRETSSADGRTEAQLIDAIRADPDDMAARAVYGDLLAEKSDPRAREINDPAPRPVRVRGARLRKVLGDELGRALANVDLKGGFLHAAAVAPTSKLPPAGWERVAGDPQLLTLRELRQEYGSARQLERLAAAPVTRHLTSIDATPAMVERLLATQHDRAYEDLVVVRQPKRGLLGRALGSPAFAQLRSLRVTVGSERLDDLLDELRPVAERLEELWVAGPMRADSLRLDALFDVHAAFPHLRRAVYACNEYNLRNEHAVLRPTDGHLRLWVYAMVLDDGALDRLPAGVGEVEVFATPFFNPVPQLEALHLRRPDVDIKLVRRER